MASSTHGLCGEASSILLAVGSCEHHKKGAGMAATQPDGQATVIAVYPDHASAEVAVRQLHKEGVPMQNLSIIGKDFQLVAKPLGLVTTGEVAKGGAKVGAWTGGILGLLVGGLLVGAA